jgi:hypothetical protein
LYVTTAKERESSASRWPWNLGWVAVPGEVLLPWDDPMPDYHRVSDGLRPSTREPTFDRMVFRHHF